MASQIPAELDSIMRAWVYYRMLTDRVETVYHREKVANILRNGENGEMNGGSWEFHLLNELISLGVSFTGSFIN